MSNIAIKDEAHWLTVRETHIGGSEIAALFHNWLLPDGTEVVLHAYELPPEGALPIGSCSPYTNAYRLFLEKSGTMQTSFKSTERMDAGTFLEPAIAQWAMKKWPEWNLRKVHRYSTHDQIEGWGCSVDFEVHGPGMAPVEIKNIDYLIARDKWVIEGDEVVISPLHIQLQLQHYIGARGASEGFIVPLVGGNTLCRGRFTRHDPTIERIGDAITAFWAAVKRGTPPLHLADADTVSEQFAKTGGPPMRDLKGLERASMLARRYKRWKAHGDFVDGVISSIKGQLGVMIGDAPKAVGDGFRVTWPVVQREEKLIPAKMQEAKVYRGGFTVTLEDPK